MEKWSMDNFVLDFLDDDSEEEELQIHDKFKVVIADDDEEIHRVTHMILRDFIFEGYGLEFIDTYSGAETIEALEKNPDTAILFLDVVMESNRAGLDVVETLRNTQNNYLTRIILRTGQPGEAPEEQIIRDYDINDYRLKTELTVKRLNTTIYSALRNYRDLTRLEKHRNGLEKIIKTSARLFEHNTLKDFLTSILNELSNFQRDNTSMLFFREEHENEKSSHGFVTMEEKNINTIVAATGQFEKYIGKNLKSIPELSFIEHWVETEKPDNKILHDLEDGYIIKSDGKSHLNNYIYIKGKDETLDVDLIQLFLANYSVTLDNYILNNMVNTTQREIVLALGEMVDSHYEETGSHIKRISQMMYEFALCNHFSYTESEMIKVASTMHDLGKVAIPDDILKKPGKLTKDEFEVIKTHTTHGHKILSQSDLEVLKIAADIALNHHEKFDGTGYPYGKSGKEISLNARMLAIVDVFDAMTHKRVYKEAVSLEETLDYLNNQKGRHFDPMLVDLFIENIDDITRFEASENLE